MKKTMLFSSALVALAMLASCQKEQPIETPATATGVTEFTATIETPTKTAIANDGKVTWVEGDEITVTDVESKSAVYVAASSGATTTFTLMQGQTAVGSGPYKATYGDITEQVYDKDGANCPLTAATTDADSKNLQFSSPYAVLKVTAKSSNSDVIKTVVVTYGDNGSFLDCGNGVTLTNDGVVFYVAVQPANAELSVAFYKDDGKVATKTRTGTISLAAKDLLPVKFESLDFGTDTPTFKAVYNTTGTLTFYYDTDEHSGSGNTVYKGSDGTNYLFDDAKSQNQKWGYYGKYSSITSVKIDPSVAGYKDLTSTAYMFVAMTNATSISGAEYLDVSNVTNMSYMFQNFGSNSTTLTDVPIVSGWNTGQVKYMSHMFRNYGSKNSTFNAVPDVSKWNTDNVIDMKYMFNNYGSSSQSLNTVPDVSKWNTNEVNDMSFMFNNYGGNSGNLNAVPIVREWDTGSVNNMDSMFKEYGKSSEVLAKAPEVSNWNTVAVTTLSDMFHDYGKTSTKLEEVPNVDGSDWKTGEVTDIDSMFQNYGNGSAKFNLDLSNWDLGKITTAINVFDVIAKEFFVKIPTKTGDIDNNDENWYFGDGTKSAINPAYKIKEGNDSDKWVRWSFNQTKPAN